MSDVRARYGGSFPKTQVAMAKAVEAALTKPARMNIGAAVEALKQGKRVARSGWNGKGMWLVYYPAGQGWYPYVVMKTADDKLVPWLCSQTDLLAEDWEIVT